MCLFHPYVWMNASIVISLGWIAETSNSILQQHASSTTNGLDCLKDIKLDSFIYEEYFVCLFWQEGVYDIQRRRNSWQDGVYDTSSPISTGKTSLPISTTRRSSSTTKILGEKR
ncbi:uncharacterized protein LOC110608287 isoform X2 [Manihot esculenta]|uniref:Uncharacterized protein n=1 Tax=Manihot esculenta TaxID=3983 RepID=A0ACB7HGL0_MANES|nr:uncharacterized protein LOC110608287 isoform X2 [Manihot esculenta]KAG8650933.1 hypothetical protein MANES_07G080855v8 [Manihot esculenta]